VEFYQSKEEEAEILSEEKEWDFVTLDDGEEDSFDKPETHLEPGLLILYKNGNGFYKAYGKYTNEEFYTFILPLKEIWESINS
jgi:hypothetical protein